MSISSSIEYTNRGVMIDDTTFVCSDLHIGYSDVVDGLTIEDERSEIADRVRKVLEEHNISRFIVAGDIFHSFTPASSEAVELFREMVARIEVDSTFTAIRGNHDEATESEYEDTLDMVDSVAIQSENGKIIVTHGDTEPQEDADLYIIGHLHPVISVDGIKWPTYLYGSKAYNSSDVLILPTYSRFQDGVTISARIKLDIDFPLVPMNDLRDFRPIIYDEDENTVREFPRLSESGQFFGS